MIRPLHILLNIHEEKGIGFVLLFPIRFALFTICPLVARFEVTKRS